jgi:hypothetical protein
MIIHLKNFMMRTSKNISLYNRNQITPLKFHDQSIVYLKLNPTIYL